MIKIAIVEDEEENIIQIQSYIEQYGNENQIINAKICKYNVKK